MNCFVTQKTVVVAFHFLVVGVCGYNTRGIKSLKTIVPLLSCTKNNQARRRGRGGGLEPPEFLEVEKNITINEPKNI